MIKILKRSICNRKDGFLNEKDNYIFSNNSINICFSKTELGEKLIPG